MVLLYLNFLKLLNAEVEIRVHDPVELICLQALKNID